MKHIERILMGMGLTMTIGAIGMIGAGVMYAIRWSWCNAPWIFGILGALIFFYLIGWLVEKTTK